MKTFKKSINDRKLNERAFASRKEAQENGVKYTPTTFLNGYLYDSYDHPMWIVDAAEYEYRRIVSGRNRR